jgi:hypothetical protein
VTDTYTQSDEAPSGYKTEFLCTIPACLRGVGGNGFATDKGRLMHERTTHSSTGSAPEAIIANDVELTAAEKKLATELTAAMTGPTLLLMLANPIDGMIVMHGTPKLVAALILCARKSKQLKAMLVFMTEATAWVQLGTAVAAIVCPILDNHHIVSIPTMTVADVLGPDAPTSSVGTVRAPARPAPQPMPGNQPRYSETSRSPSPGTPVPNRASDMMGGLAIPDLGGGMNRAARRAAEGGGDEIPPGVAQMMTAFGVTEEDLEAAAKMIAGGSIPD